MLRIPYIMSLLAAVMLLVGCPPVNPPTCEELGTCPPLPCEDEPDGCQKPKILLETMLKQPVAGEDFANYTQGEEFDGTMTLTLEDPDKTVNDAVVFLNVVECVATTEPFCKTVSNVDIRTVFDENASSFTPDINKKLYQGVAVDSLRNGVTTTLDAKLIASVKLSRYALAVQVFNCTQTDPNKVGTDPDCKRIDKTKAYRFQVTE